MPNVRMVNLRDEQVVPTINTGSGPEPFPIAARERTDAFPVEQVTSYARDLADKGWIQIKPA